MSPTVEDGDCLMDVDWRDLYEGENYLPEFIPALLEKQRGDRQFISGCSSVGRARVLGT